MLFVLLGAMIKDSIGPPQGFGKHRTTKFCTAGPHTTAAGTSSQPLASSQGISRLAPTIAHPVASAPLPVSAAAVAAHAYLPQVQGRLPGSYVPPTGIARPPSMAGGPEHPNTRARTPVDSVVKPLSIVRFVLHTCKPAPRFLRFDRQQPCCFLNPASWAQPTGHQSMITVSKMHIRFEYIYFDEECDSFVCLFPHISLHHHRHAANDDAGYATRVYDAYWCDVVPGHAATAWLPAHHPSRSHSWQPAPRNAASGISGKTWL